MRRRSFIAGLSLATTIGSARAQQSAKQYRIAIFDPATPVAVMNEFGHPQYPLWKPFFTELRRLGYVEGQNLVVERYSGEGAAEHFPEQTRKIVDSKPDLIFVDAPRNVPDVLSATKTIPIIGVLVDPVRAGLIASVARPGGNLTGISVVAGPEMVGKRLELLREIVPGMSRVGFLGLRATQEIAFGRELQDSAQKFGVVLVGPSLEAPITEAEFRRVISAMSREKADALLVGGDVEVFTNAPLVVGLVQQAQLPAIYVYSYLARIGGLMSYDVGISEFGRVAADQADKILRGTPPGEIPFYQPTKFELVINMKTAKALGLTVPTSVLVRADEVIE
jgi:putative tryptophan/tyrosine transport system substrate-binding protein